MPVTKIQSTRSNPCNHLAVWAEYREACSNRDSDSIVDDYMIFCIRLVEELLPWMLDEQSGCSGMVPGWDFSCVTAGTVIADLAVEFRIDTDQNSLLLVDVGWMMRSGIRWNVMPVATKMAFRNT